MMNVVIAVLFWCGVITAVIGSNKGYQPFLWFFLGLLLGPLGVVIAIQRRMRDGSVPPPMQGLASPELQTLKALNEIKQLMEQQAKTGQK